MIRLPSVFVTLACVGSLACHRSPPQDTSPTELVAEAGPSSFPDPMADISPNAPVATVAAPDVPSIASQGDASASADVSDFRLRFEEDKTSIGGSNILVIVDNAGQLFSRTALGKNFGCSTSNIGQAGLAKVNAAAEKAAYFSLVPNGYDGPLNKGLTRIRIRSNGRDKIVLHRGPINFDPKSPDADDRQRIDALEKTIQSVTKSESLPFGACSRDLFAHLNF